MLHNTPSIFSRQLFTAASPLFFPVTVGHTARCTQIHHLTGDGVCYGAIKRDPPEDEVRPSSTNPPTMSIVRR